MVSLIGLNLEYFTNLVKLEILITDDYMLNRFKVLIQGSANTIESLTIKFLATNAITMNNLVLNTLDSIAELEKLSEFQIELYFKLNMNRIVFENDKINLTTIIDSISGNEILSNKINSFTLIIDVNYVQLKNLNLVKCLNAFCKANSLSILIYNEECISLDKFKLNFDQLAPNYSIKHFKIDCSNFSNKDFIDLISKYPNLITLDIACGNRLSRFSSIPIVMNFLQVLSVKKSFGNNKKLSINDFVLDDLFDQLSFTLPSLRILKFADCKIHFSFRSLIEKIRQMALEHGNETYRIILINNNFPIMNLPSFRLSYRIPDNLKLDWFWEKPFNETWL